MKCRYCGYEIPDGELYCEHCGKEVRIVPDYNPLDDMLTAQIKVSLDGEEPEDEAFNTAPVRNTGRNTGRRTGTDRGTRQGTSRNTNRSTGRRGSSPEMERRRRRQQQARKKAGNAHPCTLPAKPSFARWTAAQWKILPGARGASPQRGPLRLIEGSCSMQLHTESI